MSTTVLGVGEYGVTTTPGSALKTFALGSCVAVILYDLHARAAGMAHIALPSSATNPKRADVLPAYFADTGIPVLLNSLFSATGRTNKSGLLVKLVGGANIMKCHAAFNIGNRNLEAISLLLTQQGLTPMAQDVNGSLSRTVAISSDTGKVVITSPGRSSWEI